VERLAGNLGLETRRTALGIVEVADAHMERALRVISVERGRDPRDFTLVSFGGAGGLHAAELARRLGIRRVLVPPQASTLSAFGMLAAEVVKDYSLTVMLAGDTALAELEARLAPLAERGRADVADEGVPAEAVSIARLLDMRYRGQSYELTVPLSDNLADDFQAAHQQAYGYARPGAATEIVNVRVRAVGRASPPPILASPRVGEDASFAILDRRPVTLSDGQEARVPFYQAESLRPGNRLAGPAVVVRSDTTIIVGAGDQAEVDPRLNLIIRVHLDATS
jgi:N-methylhydantoinase A